ncbi:MAG TPA: UDP-3-O-(3-hydroxymyristoyl)glucosamine N-acyltransferase [Chthoniobacterales bacterium]
MTLTVDQIVALVGGRLASGSGSSFINGAASLVEAQKADISFFGNAKYLADLKTTNAGAVLVRPGVDVSLPDAALIAVENPSLSFAAVLEKLRPEPLRWAPGIHPTAVIGEDSQIDPSASIQPYAVIESGVKIGARSVVGAHVFIGRETTLGDDCFLHPNATIRERTVIGHRVILHSGSVIGSDGFGYETVKGKHEKIPQIGIVQIDNDVEIGAGTTIDRARFGRTWIGEGTKIDNLVQIAHNVVIGKHCIIVSQAGISGSSRLGNYVILAGKAGVAGHLTIGDHAIVGGNTGISKHVPPGQKWFGFVGENAKDMAEKLALISRLPKLFDRVKELEKALDQN